MLGKCIGLETDTFSIVRSAVVFDLLPFRRQCNQRTHAQNISREDAKVGRGWKTLSSPLPCTPLKWLVHACTVHAREHPHRSISYRSRSLPSRGNAMRRTWPTLAERGEKPAADFARKRQEKFNAARRMKALQERVRQKEEAHTGPQGK
jgi:hypothetical protein